MRELEFRAWLKDEKKMVEVDSIDFSGQWILYKGQETQRFYRFNEIELIEYTGIKDRNGVKIFEGDIFIDNKGDVYSDADDDNKYIGVVKYSEQFAWFIIEWFENLHSKEPLDDEPLGHINIHNMEVIGNIYENPEFLEVK